MSTMKWSFIDYTKEKYFLHYNLHELDIDEFYLTFVNHLTTNNTYLYTLDNDCIECPYTKDTLLPYRNNGSFKPINITHHYTTNLKFRIASGGQCGKYVPQNETQSVVCDIDNNFGQFGVYDVNINHTGCLVNTLKEPVNIYSPIVTVFLIYFFLYLIISKSIFVWKKFYHKNRQEHEENITENVRIQSLDTFRGLTIVMMIFANLGSGNYHFIKHTTWNGLNVADLVFPCFVWIMGVCIPLTLTANFKKGLSNKTIILNAFKRFVKLFCLGIFLVSETDAKYLRIFGILQRLGVSYFAVTTICLFCIKRSNLKETKRQTLGIRKDFLTSFHFISLTLQKKIEDILILAKGWIVVFLILITHIIITFYIAAPGCPKGYLGPGGLHKNGLYQNCAGGATGYVDELILGRHRSQHPKVGEIYTTSVFEHAGIVGCLTTIFHVFIGVQAGVTMMVYQNDYQRLLRWMIWAVVCGLIGGELCSFSKENGVIPINWNLWSLSFVFVTSSFAFTLLSVFYILVDVKKWWSGKPFFFVGMNSILIYVGHQMTTRRFPFKIYVPVEVISRRTHFGALLSDTWGATAWIIVSYYLYSVNYFCTV